MCRQVYADEEEMVSEIASGFDTAFTGDGPLDNYVLLRWRAKFDVPTAGEYEFKIRSDDGALLYIDEELVVNNDGVHPPRNRDGEITLAAGEHTFAIAFFDRKGGATLQVEWSPTPGARLSDFLNDDLRSVESNCPCQDWMTTTVTTTVTTTDPTTGAVVVEEVEEEVFDAASYNAGLAGNAAGRVAVSNDEHGGMGAGWVILIVSYCPAVVERALCEPPMRLDHGLLHADSSLALLLCRRRLLFSCGKKKGGREHHQRHIGFALHCHRQRRLE